MSMHHHHRARTTGFLSTAQAMRLVSMVAMLVVIGLTIERTGPWRRNLPVPNPPQGVNQQSAGPAIAPDPPVMASDAADSPDDRDPDEMAAFRHEIETVADGATLILPVEMPAYWRLLKWVTDRSTAELAARHPRRVTFQELRQYPDKYRGQLVELELNIRQAFANEEMAANNPAGVTKLYELWGFPTAGRGWLYDVLTPEVPAGFPEGSGIKQTVRVYGYFFKLQGYQPLGAKPYAPPQVAPLIIGRIESVSTAAAVNPAEETLTYIVLIGGGAILLCAIGYWIVAAQRRKSSRAQAGSAWPSSSPGPAHDRLEEGLDESAPRETASDGFDWLRE
jgi:hypothetical protein